VVSVLLSIGFRRSDEASVRISAQKASDTVHLQACVKVLSSRVSQAQGQAQGQGQGRGGDGTVSDRTEGQAIRQVLLDEQERHAVAARQVPQAVSLETEWLHINAIRIQLAWRHYLYWLDLRNANPPVEVELHLRRHTESRPRERIRRPGLVAPQEEPIADSAARSSDLRAKTRPLSPTRHSASEAPACSTSSPPPATPPQPRGVCAAPDDSGEAPTQSPDRAVAPMRPRSAATEDAGPLQSTGAQAPPHTIEVARAASPRLETTDDEDPRAVAQQSPPNQRSTVVRAASPPPSTSSPPAPRRPLEDLSHSAATQLDGDPEPPAVASSKEVPVVRAHVPSITVPSPMEARRLRSRSQLTAKDMFGHSSGTAKVGLRDHSTPPPACVCQRACVCERCRRRPQCGKPHTVN
jgi:hypothetical protein